MFNTPADSTRSLQAGSTTRVLIVDDNLVNRKILNRMLSQLSFLVEEAANGLEALNLVQAHPADYFDFCIMDLHMDTMDGYESTRRIRALGDDYKALPICALTANPQSEEKDRAQEAGMNYFPAKPIRKIELVKSIEKMMKPGQSSPATRYESVRSRVNGRLMSPVVASGSNSNLTELAGPDIDFLTQKPGQLVGGSQKDAAVKDDIAQKEGAGSSHSSPFGSHRKLDD